MTFRLVRLQRSATATLIVIGATLVGASAHASASMGCGDYSFSFEGTRLLNDGISDAAGPFPISLPAGTYDITPHSFDDHSAHPGQVEQTQEQWYFTLDNGYESPISSDIADDVVYSSDVFTAVALEDATAITVQHLRAGGINSVSPLCVGFTTTAAPSPATGETNVSEPIVLGPALPPAADDAGPVPVEVEPDALLRQATDEPPATQLALTGAGGRTATMVALGVSLLLAGVALVQKERGERLRL